ncbi:tumor necrosis factor receptor superfamily member 5 [Salmo salar]|uniref:Tumor necrosis factor receptor superfamily member 5 n=1 Tax=Salmo salar TaxID=8030 RepID=A0A1S3P1A4_SALSA|nr:tumor necrosis factor receptor superfamily member 5-like [Salmo salar]|eukprot:XP_014021320.1 PREDICTED: tumor necrosis factor receptor superfamily member 5-like [Salmo salar]
MNTQYIQMTVICFLCFWTMGLAADLRCNDMYEKDGRCCELCPPGTFLKKHCTTQAKTDCGDCPADSYSEFSDRTENCQPCLKCQQVYARACTSTANANCSCGSGFLCSDHVCSKCEKEKKCRKGEELKRTGSREYTWKCVPCPNNTYSDTEQGHCKPLTQCGTFGFVVIFPGNKTHNSKCGIHGNKEDGRYILAIGFFFFAVVLLVFLIYACIRRIEHKPKANIHGCPLSKEESGGQLIQ